MKTILKKGIKEIPSFLVLIYICFFVSLLFATIFTTAPREIRDAANVSLAQQFANMQNPYVVTNEHEYIESINVYPPLNMLIAAALHMLTTLNLYNIFYALDFLYIILTAALITRFIQKYYNASLFLCLLVFAASLTLGWRTGFISTIPDHLGMLIIVMLLISPKSSHRFSILTDSILTVLSFYSKQYFLAVCVTVFLYHLLHDYKAAFRYFIYTAILGILSITILNILFPALSIQLLFFMSAENSGINAGKILYSLKQIFFAFATYGIFSLFVLKRYIGILHNLIIKKITLKDVTIFDINNLVMLLILLYLGTNKGAFLSYHLTLLLPSLLITGSNEINNFCIRYTSTKQTLFKLIMCIVSLLLLIKKYEFPYVYTKEIQAQYSLIENTLSQYDKQTIYLVPQLGYYAYDTQIELAENGHKEYIITLSDSKVIKNPINIDKEARIYPYLSTLYAYSVNRKAEISELIDNQAFSLITRTNGATTLWGYDLCNNYICIESLPIRTGNQNTIIDFWIPKTSSP